MLYAWMDMQLISMIAGGSYRLLRLTQDNMIAGRSRGSLTQARGSMIGKWLEEEKEKEKEREKEREREREREREKESGWEREWHHCQERKSTCVLMNACMCVC